MGWRVEFRPMEVQLTDFENAAYAVFIILLTRAILKFKLGFYIPISKVDENMKIAQKCNAVSNEKFYFTKSVYQSPSSMINGICLPCCKKELCCRVEYEMMTLNEIFNGKVYF